MIEPQFLDAIVERCSEALYLSERAHSALPVTPYADAAPAVKDYCRRRVRSVLGASSNFLDSLAEQKRKPIPTSLED